MLTLTAPVVSGQRNEPDDVFATDNAMREAGIYSPPPPYDSGPARYLHEPMVDAIESFQKRNGLKVDGYLNPGGPTERAINNRLLDKPPGAGLLYEPIEPLGAPVGNGMENRRDDVRSIQRSLGALGLIPEDPFDDPHGFIDEPTSDGLRLFQESRGLRADGWMGPGGESERALREALSDLVRESGQDWLAYADRAGRAQAALVKEPPYTWNGSQGQQLVRTLEQRPGDTDGLAIVPLQGRGAISRLLPPGIGKPGEVDADAELPALPPIMPPLFDQAVPPPDSEEATRKTEVLPFVAATDEELKSFKEAKPLRDGDNLDWIIIERKGNERTRRYNHNVVEKIESIAANHRCGADHTGGSRAGEDDYKKRARGEEISETHLGPRKSGSWADITFTIKHGKRKLFINTYDVANRTLAATRREWGNAIRLLGHAARGDILILLPKLRDDQALDAEGFERLINNALDELCEPPPDGEQYTDKNMLESLIQLFRDTKPLP